MWRAFCVVAMFHLTCLGWMIFRAESFESLVSLLHTLVTRPELGLAADWLLPVTLLVLPLVAMQVLQARWRDLEAVLRLAVPLRTCVYALLVLTLLLAGVDHGDPFLYFQF